MESKYTRISCAGCHRRLKIRNIDGVQVRCPNCGKEFFVQVSAAAPPPAPPVAEDKVQLQIAPCKAKPEQHPHLPNRAAANSAECGPPPVTPSKRQQLAHPSLRRRPRRQRSADQSAGRSSLRKPALAACLAACVFSLVGVYAAVASEFRIWRNSSGQKSKIKMSLIDSSDSLVRLKREDDGREFEIPISKLSKEDRDYIRGFKIDTDTPAAPKREITVLPDSLEASATTGGDFSQWRGFGRDGVVHGSPRLSNSWSASGPRQLWTSDRIPAEWGGGWGSVAVQGDRVFVYANICPSRGAEGPIAQDIVYCLSSTNGETLWRFQHDGGRHNSPSNSTPTIDSGRCYVHGSGGMFYCLDARTGREIWVAEAERPASNETSSSFAIAGNVADVMSPHLTGVDTKTGQILWIRSSVRSRHSSPAIWKHRGQTFAVCHSDRGLFCVDVRTGEVAWQTRGGGGESSPIVVGDVAIERTRGEMIAYDLLESEATERWRVGFGDEGSSPLVFDGHVYAIKQGGDGICVRLSDGQEKWRTRIARGRFSSPVAADGKLFMVLGSEIYMLAGNSDDKQVLDHANLNIESCTSPAISRGRLFIRQRNGIACYNLQ